MNKFPLKGIVSLLLIFGGAAVAFSGFLPRRNTSAYDLNAFGRLPVQYGGRVLPVDSVARNALRLLSGRTVVRLPTPNEPGETVKIPALQWFLDLALRPEAAERMPVFRVNHDEVLGLFGKTQQGSQLFSFDELSAHFEKIQHAAASADEKRRRDEKLNLFDAEISRLRDNLVLFQRLSVSFAPPGETPARDLELWQSLLKAGSDALLAKAEGRPHDAKIAESFGLFARRFMELSRVSVIGLVPPAGGADPAATPWANLGEGAIDALKTNQISPILLDYAKLGRSLRANDPQAFNAALASLQQDLSLPGQNAKIRFEAFLNNLEPFYRGSILYVLAFLCACVSWAAWGPELRRAAVWLMVFGLALHLFLFARLYLTGYWVITNLYSSALFVGFIAVLGGLVIESFTRRAVGAAVASYIGFATLVIAHNLPFSGDTFDKPQAVLATNLWLSTHVTCITMGYAAMFVAGTLATGYIVANVLGKLEPPVARMLTQVTYGVMCFAMLFTFVGTMLGGIWADQSWGRFWGWDPKENGALLIVLWCAIWLHARWGGLTKPRGQMALAVGGNIVTAWSWFGVNLLGVGLHSYGFMDGTKWALICFAVSQIVLIALAFLPARFWRIQPAAA